MRASGFSLLEMLTVMAVIGILVSIAIPGFGYLAASTKVKGASTELYLAMVRARSEAVKRNRAVAVLADAAGWQAGWRIVSDSNNDGDFVDADDTVVYTQGALNRVAVNLDCDAAPTEALLGAGEDNTEVRFRPNGRIVSAPTCAGAPSFEVTSVDPDRQQALMRCIRADLTGRPYVTTTGVTAANC